MGRGIQIDRVIARKEAVQVQVVAVGPTLLIVGDEDAGCLETNLMLKRTILSAGLVVLPKSGHTLNLEEPELFNRLVADFLAAVDAGRWSLRDPRSVSQTVMGISG
jgi:hypothetical protein